MQNKVLLSACVFALLPLLFACGNGKESASQDEGRSVKFNVANSSDLIISDAFILLNASDLQLLDSKFYKVFSGDLELSSQLIRNGSDQHLAVSIPKIEGKQKLELAVRPVNSAPVYTQLTQAELSHKVGGHFENREYIGGHFENVDSIHVPAEHTDHSWFIRYEGPGWESDLVSYRFYLDWRNGIDVFGKKVKTPVLQDVGQDGFDSYHEPADWGMDVLKVGKTLGLGSIATFENGKARRVDVTDSLYAEITNNGAIYSSIFTRYSGWDLPAGKTDILAEISIHNGTRLSRMDLTSTADLPNFATGLIKDSKGEVLKSDSNLEYSYLATYGPQSLADDNLGIAVIYPTSQLIQDTEDELSHVLVFDSSSKKLSYYFLAAWEQEPEGITSMEEFKKYLDQEILKLSNPLKITVK